MPPCGMVLYLAFFFAAGVWSALFLGRRILREWLRAKWLRALLLTFRLLAAVSFGVLSVIMGLFAYSLCSFLR